MENHFQVVILGTGLVESIAAAGLAKAGFSVAHLDPNGYYGAGQASLTADELVEWTDRHMDSSIYTNIIRLGDLPAQSRQYALSLAPAFIPSLGLLITSLVASGVARYGGYKLLESTAVYAEDRSVRVVPGSKEDVFKNKDMSLVDKRRLMRFLMFAAGEFENSADLSGNEPTPFFKFLREKYALPERVAEAVTYALAFRMSPQDPTIDALHYIRTVLRSSGRYGPSPFIVGHYGGCGEIAQGYCRTAAVHGAVYILGREVLDIVTRQADSAESEPCVGSFEVEVADLPDKLTCDVVLSAADLVPASIASNAKSVSVPVPSSPLHIARCIAILDHPIFFDKALTTTSPEADIGEASELEEREPIDTGILVFPPGSVSGGSPSTAVATMIMGESSMSTPAGKWVAYLSMPVSAETSESAQTLLHPYLSALLHLSITPDQTAAQSTSPTFAVFYTEHPSDAAYPAASVTNHPSSAGGAAATVLVSPTPSPLISEASDSAAKAGEALFWACVASLRARGIKPGMKTESEGPTSEGDVWPESIWPPLEVQDGEEF